MKNSRMNRRSFLGRLSLSVTLLAVAPAVFRFSRAGAADLVPLSPDEPAAKSFRYVESAADAKGSGFKAGSKCANCALYTSGTDAGQGSCGIFSGKLVKSEGWCMAWSAKA